MKQVRLTMNAKYHVLRAIGVLLWMAMCPLALATAENDVAKQEVEEIRVDATWARDRQVMGVVRIESATLRIQAGVTVTFENGGRIVLTDGASLIAEGTDEQAINLRGNDTGIIEGHHSSVLLKHCLIKQMGVMRDKKRLFLSVSAKPGCSLKLVHCDMVDGAGMYLNPGGGEVEVSHCNIRGKDLASITVYGAGRVLVEYNTMVAMNVSISGGNDAIVRDNILIKSAVGGWRNASLLVERNYIHQPRAEGSYCIPGANGIIRDNVLRGGSWVTARVTGEMTGNVLLSLPHDGIGGPDEYDKNCTHEHICGMGPDSVVRRNIFVGASYGAVMGLGTNTCSRLEFSNNTIDMRNRGTPVMLNHLPERPSEKIVIRNNIFMRSTGCLDERGVHNAASYLDYNLWADVPDKEQRYRKMTIDNLRFGEDGFGGNDIPRNAGSIPRAKVVKNADAAFPFRDEDMLARRHKVADILAYYRDAYALVPESRAIDAGDPTVVDDNITDGKPDIGAIESVRKSSPNRDSSSAAPASALRGKRGRGSFSRLTVHVWPGPGAIAKPATARPINSSKTPVSA